MMTFQPLELQRLLALQHRQSLGVPLVLAKSEIFHRMHLACLLIVRSRDDRFLLAKYRSSLKLT